MRLEQLHSIPFPRFTTRLLLKPPPAFPSLRFLDDDPRLHRLLIAAHFLEFEP